jgi:hypothetical protein
MAATCQAAAAAVAKPYGGAVLITSRPGGCFVDKGNPNQVYFNTNATGAAFANAQPLCVFGAPACACLCVYSFGVLAVCSIYVLTAGDRGDFVSTDALNGAALTPAVVRHVCAATYATNAANTNACEAGYSKITDPTTCRAAAAFLGTPYGNGISSTIQPSGCYLGGLGPMVYLNTHPTGGASLSAQPLCQFGASPQPPSPSTPQGYAVGGVPGAE